jgi:hypothetical protein
MADQEFLASFGVEIDESGLDRLQKALKQNRTLAEELASAFDSARNAVSEFFKQLSASTLPSGELSPYQRLMELSEKGISFSMDLDVSDAEEKLDHFFLYAQQMFDTTVFPLNADASAVLTAGRDALGKLQALYASTRLTVNASVNVQGGSGPTGSGGGSSLMKSAAGGRFSAPAVTEIAEDGDPEYVIPVKKESIAVPLLRQLIGELSDSARETLKAGLGEKGRGDALSGLPDLLASAPAAAAPVINQNNNQSVEAPVSINVIAAGSDPEAVGRSIYDVAERYLLRTLQAL